MISSGKQISRLLWRFATSENALAMIKVAATLAAFVHSVEEWRKTNRSVGFKVDNKSKIGFRK